MMMRAEASSGTSMIWSAEEGPRKRGRLLLLLLLSSCHHRVVDGAWVVENNTDKVATDGVNDRVVRCLDLADVLSELRDVTLVMSDSWGAGVLGSSSARQGFVVGEDLELLAFKEVLRVEWRRRWREVPSRKCYIFSGCRGHGG